MILCPLSIALILLTTLCILSITGFIIRDNSAGISMASVILIFTLIFGWLILGILMPIQYLQREVPAEIIKTDKSIIVIVNGIPIKTFTDVVSYKFYQDKTNATLIQNGFVNIYSNTVWNKYIIKHENHNTNR